MTKVLQANIFLVAFATIFLCFIISFISTDIVLNDQIYNKYLDDKYEAKYNEFKDLDINLDDFADELKQFEQNDEELNTYGWDYLYIDLMSIVVPLLVVIIGFSGVFLVLILFHKRLHLIKYTHLLKASLISYIVFYIPEIMAAVYFLIFNRKYGVNEIRDFSNKFSLSVFFDDKQTTPWLWKIVSQTDINYFIFPLVVAFLIKKIYKNFEIKTLIGYSYLAYSIIFLFYNTVFWYLFDLI